MKKATVIISTILIIILVLAGIILFSLQGNRQSTIQASDSQELLYQTFNADNTNCYTNLSWIHYNADASTTFGSGSYPVSQYTIFRSDVNQIFIYTSLADTFAQRPEFNNISYAFTSINPSCINTGFTINKADLDRISQEFYQTQVDDCQGLGSIDPYPYNGIKEIKCNAYCRPNLGACVLRTDGKYEAQHCLSDGSRIVSDICSYGCSSGSCVGGIDRIYLTLTKNGEYIISKDAKLDVDINLNTVTLVNGKIVQNGNTIQEVSQYTSTEGLVTLLFPNVNVVGQAIIQVSASDPDGTLHQENIDVNFSETPITLTAINPKYTYNYGNDVGLSVNVKTADVNYAGANIEAKIIKNNATYKQTTCITDLNGNCNVNISNVNILGTASITLSTTIRGNTKSIAIPVYFEGSPIKVTASTVSPIQYSSDPVNFIVHIETEDKRLITPDELLNMYVLATLTNGQVKNSTITYLGNGDYKIISTITGTGTYNGALYFNYLTVNKSSQGISIDIRNPVLGIDTTSIQPYIYLNETGHYTISITSSSGNKVDPDSIQIEVTKPSGFEKETINMNQLTRVTEGVYSFDYSNFNIVEQYTFNFYVDKNGFSRGTAKASVACTTKSGTEGQAGGSGIAFFSQYGLWIFLIIIIGLIIYFVYKRFKK
jgi:hypothetical protein